MASVYLYQTWQHWPSGMCTGQGLAGVGTGAELEGDAMHLAMRAFHVQLHGIEGGADADDVFPANALA